MPFTFRALMQGIAAAAPQVVELMQQDEERKLQNRKLGLDAAGLKIQEGQLDLMKSNAEFSRKAYEETTKPLAQEQIAASKSQTGISERAATLAEERGRIEASIAKNNLALSNEMAKFTPELAQAARDKVVLEVKRLTQENATLLAQAEMYHLQGQKYRLETADAGFSFRTKMAQTMAGVANNPKLQAFFAEEFDSPESAMKKLATIDIDPTTRSALLGTTEPVLRWMAQANQQKALILESAAVSKLNKDQVKRLTDSIDTSNAAALYNVLTLYGVPDMYPLLNHNRNPDGSLIQTPKTPAAGGGGVSEAYQTGGVLGLADPAIRAGISGVEAASRGIGTVLPQLGKVETGFRNVVGNAVKPLTNAERWISNQYSTPADSTREGNP